jgi:hypothetical protein
VTPALSHLQADDGARLAKARIDDQLEAIVPQPKNKRDALVPLARALSRGRQKAGAIWR